MSRFQLIFTGALLALGVGGAILFAVAKNNSTSTNAPQLVLWGTIKSQTMAEFLDKANRADPAAVNISYKEENPATLEQDLIGALARGQGPDMILLPQDLIVKE